MSRIFLLRHGATDWNAAHRIQGATDIELADATREKLRRMRLPREWLDIPWYSSPLRRCLETAALLGADAVVAEALTEMEWGEFEGLTLSEVNARIRHLDLQPSRGLDLRPPGGESPRMVRERLAGWLHTLPVAAPVLVAATHKGVIRSALSLATGWNMMTPFSQTVDWRLPLCFEWDGRNLHLIRVNCRWRDTSLLEPTGRLPGAGSL